MKITELRSSYDEVGGIVHFGRMIDKIRLCAAGDLPGQYHAYLGETNPYAFDSRCCRFLKIDYGAFATQVKEGESDEALFEWACNRGRKPSEFEIEVWNGFMKKRGWRDRTAKTLQQEAKESGISDRVVATFFDLYDAEEGRPSRFPNDSPATGIPPAPDRVTVIPGLRSPRETVGGVYHFGRMLDKIRLHHRGKLPGPWAEAKGAVGGFDGICCRFLQIDYAAVEEETLKGLGDSELFEWATTAGRRPNDEEIEIWNAYLSKRCWRDKYIHRVHARLGEVGMAVGSVYTMFDFIDLDEGRPYQA